MFSCSNFEGCDRVAEFAVVLAAAVTAAAPEGMKAEEFTDAASVSVAGLSTMADGY